MSTLTTLVPVLLAICAVLSLRLAGALACVVCRTGPHRELWTWRRRIRRSDAEPVYMDRWQLFRSPWIDVYINRINLPDRDDLPHNHPWRKAWSLKLRGSYLEEVWYRRARNVFKGSRLTRLRRMPPRWSRIPKVHKILALDFGRPCWTLFIGVGRAHAWGFVDPATGELARPGGSDATRARRARESAAGSR